MATRVILKTFACSHPNIIFTITDIWLFVWFVWIFAWCVCYSDLKITSSDLLVNVAHRDTWVQRISGIQNCTRRPKVFSALWAAVAMVKCKADAISCSFTTTLIKSLIVEKDEVFLPKSAPTLFSPMSENNFFKELNFKNIGQKSPHNST